MHTWCANVGVFGAGVVCVVAGQASRCYAAPPFALPESGVIRAEHRRDTINWCCTAFDFSTGAFYKVSASGGMGRDAQGKMFSFTAARPRPEALSLDSQVADFALIEVIPQAVLWRFRNSADGFDRAPGTGEAAWRVRVLNASLQQHPGVPESDRTTVIRVRKDGIVEAVLVEGGEDIVYDYGSPLGQQGDVRVPAVHLLQPSLRLVSASKGASPLDARQEASEIMQSYVRKRVAPMLGGATSLGGRSGTAEGLAVNLVPEAASGSPSSGSRGEKRWIVAGAILVAAGAIGWGVRRFRKA